MRRDLIPLAAAGFSLFAVGCTATTPPVTPVATASIPRPAAAPPADVQALMGRDARTLEAQFGKPALDVREGTARKLQFAGASCVMDAYLYPPQSGAEPVVTHIDTRLPDGRDTDRASCVSALTRQGAAR